MPIGRKVLLYLVFPVLLLGVVGILGVTSIGRLGKAADDILSNNYHTIRQARGMEVILRRLESKIAAPAPAEDGSFKALANGFERLLSECRRSITEPTEKRALGDIDSLFRELRARLRAPGADGADADRVGLVFVNRLYQRLDNLVAVNEKAMLAYEDKTSQIARIQKAVMIGTLAAAAVVLVLFAVVAARRLSAPIVDVADRLHRALRDERGRPASRNPARDEIARLRDELDRLLARLARYEDRLSRRILEAERQLMFVVDKLDHGLLLVGKDLEILAINRTGRALLGLSDDGEVPSSLAGLRLSGDVAAALAPMLGGGGQPLISSPHVLQMVKGAAVTYRVEILTFEGAAPDSGGYLVLFWDMTEERQFQEAREQFIATMSHQLKTPITSLSMAINLMWENRESSGFDTTELLEIARTDCAAVAAIVSELVDISRNLDAAIKLTLRLADLPSLVETTLKSLRTGARTRGIELVSRLGESPLWVELDEVKFPWAISNIVGNALRCTPPSGRITVEIVRREHHVSIAISDTGRGIDANQRRRLFMPFVSLDPHPQSDAFGIGLVVAKRVVEGHGGSISVESEPGRGTTFMITLPLPPPRTETDVPQTPGCRGDDMNFAAAEE
jgi:two-component system, NtrC family, sensor histidine kinase KinB